MVLDKVSLGESEKPFIPNLLIISTIHVSVNMPIKLHKFLCTECWFMQQWKIYEVLCFISVYLDNL